MEQTNLTNTEDSPQETRHLGDKKMHIVDETFRPLQKKLDDEHEVIVELQGELNVEDSSHKKDDPKTDADLKKLGLTEEILLALPFGYATKVRSAFEKLSYENEKLSYENEKLSRENEELLKKDATLVREIEQLKGEREKLNSSLFEVLKSLENQGRRNSEPLRETDHMSFSELKIRLMEIFQVEIYDKSEKDRE